MIVDLVLRDAVGEARDICVVTVDQNARLLFFEDWRQNLGRPKDVGMLAGPSVMGISVQAMDKDDIDYGFLGTRGVDFGQTVPVDGDSLTAWVTLLSLGWRTDSAFGSRLTILNIDRTACSAQHPPILKDP